LIWGGLKFWNKKYAFPSLQVESRYLDEQLGEATTLQALATRALILEAVFLLGLLVLVPLYSTTATFLYYTFADATQQCGAAAFMGVVGNVGNSLSLESPSWVGTISASGAFWPPGHLVTFVLLHRWQPDFRTSWDGLVAVSWNTFLMAYLSLGALEGTKDTCAVPAAAIGPLLTALPPEPKEGREAAADCSRWSVAAVLRRIWDTFVGILQAICETIWKYLCIAWRVFLDVSAFLWKWTCIIAEWCKVNIKAFSWWCYRTFRVTCWYLWYLFCFIVLLVGILIRCSSYIVLQIGWSILTAFCKTVDFIKTCMLLWVVPNIAIKEGSCPHCWIWPPNEDFPRTALTPDAPWPFQPFGLSIFAALIGEVAFFFIGYKLVMKILKRREAARARREAARAKAKAKSRSRGWF
jgi:hypothetical protein